MKYILIILCSLLFLSSAVYGASDRKVDTNKKWYTCSELRLVILQMGSNFVNDMALARGYTLAQIEAVIARCKLKRD